MAIVGERCGWDQETVALSRWRAHLRQLIETVNSQLALQLHVETNHAHSFWGLSARLYTKLTAHTLCVWLNRLLGVADVLHLKALAFPHNEHNSLLVLPCGTYPPKRGENGEPENAAATRSTAHAAQGQDSGEHPTAPPGGRWASAWPFSLASPGCCSLPSLTQSPTVARELGSAGGRLWRA